MSTTNRRVLTINEAAKLIDGLTEYCIRQMCISGQLPCFMAGRKYLIAEENLYKAVFGGGEPPLAICGEVYENSKNMTRPQVIAKTVARGGDVA